MDRYLYALLALGTQLTATMAEAVKHRNRGQGFVEYAFILLFVAVALTVALVPFRGAIADLFTRITTCMGQNPLQVCS